MSPATIISVLGLALAFGLPAAGLYRRRTASGEVDWTEIRRTRLRNVAVLVAVVGVALVGDPAGLGFRVPSVGAVVDGLLFGFVAFAGTMLLVGLLLQFSGGVVADEATLVVLDQPISRQLAVAVTGSVVETTVFYGFVVETLLGFGTAPWLAGAAAAVGVVASRARWGPRQALQWLPGSVVLAGVALWSRTTLVAVGVRLAYDSLTLLSGEPEDYETPSDA